MSLINVALYGDKPIRAEYIYCDCYDDCPFYQTGQCLNCTSLFSDYCKFGKLSKVNGPKTKCRSRDTFVSNTRANEKYSKLQRPGTWTVRKLNGYVALNLSKWCIEKRKFIHSEWTTTEDYNMNDYFSQRLSWIPEQDFNIPLLKKIFSYRAQYAMSWEENPRYSKEILPNLCYELRKYFPELYEGFVEKYPEYNLIPNHVGKYAKICTLNKESEYDLGHGKFHWEGEYLVCTDYRSTFNPLDAKSVEIRFIPTEDMTCKITDNDQVIEETVFT